MYRLASNSLCSAARLYSTAAPAPPTKKIGAFRGGFVGFLLGVSVAGTASYYYLLEEYNRNTKIVMLDVISLRESLDALEKHIKNLEEKK
ncbi:hypothetical_protein [Candidozyma auris]|uniref:hypothetical_protein n=1 Tax=Candidozyma auris TaxID=498019 RepID=UPI000D2892DC|nr:hypothetical_protein [[Candida] auris]QEO21949.1 hypothetical_protein [[Candida] auris]